MKKKYRPPKLRVFRNPSEMLRHFRSSSLSEEDEAKLNDLANKADSIRTAKIDG